MKIILEDDEKEKKKLIFKKIIHYISEEIKKIFLLNASAFFPI
jgi:hypothetical protein